MKVSPNVATSFEVSLPTAAPVGGVKVTLASSDTSKVVVTPSSVLVPPGATTPALQPQVTGVGIGLATITAASPGYTSATATVTVTAPTLAFTGSPLTIAIGGTGSLTLSLSGGQAPPGGLTLSLSSSDTSKVTVPATVSFAPGATSATVTVTGAAAGAATITAGATGIASVTANVTVTPPPTVTAAYGANYLAIVNVVLTDTSAVTAVNLRIVSVTNIVAAAPNAIALTPDTIIPRPFGNLAGGEARASSWIFTATAGSLSVPFSFTITYQADNMPPRTAVIHVPFPRSMSFSGSPLALNAGASGNLTLNLLGNQAPAGGLTVTLSSSDPSRATVPATVSFAPGATSVPVPVTGRAPGSVTITANATVVNFPATATATVNVTGAIAAPASTAMGLGRSAPFVVTLPAPAPAGGVTVTLTSSDSSKVTVAPASVVIPQGATSAATPPQVTGAGIGAATITAAAAGYAPGSGTVTVAAPTMAFTGPPLSIVIGRTGNLTLRLTGGQAPAGGLTVSLTSSDASKATVPATVSFAPGATSATVTVTGAAVGSATITAGAAGIVSATASVTVTPPPTVTAAYGANSLGVINVILTNTSAVTAINLRIVSVTNITAAAPNVIALAPGSIIPRPFGNLAGGAAQASSWIFTATAGSLSVPFSFTITYQADNMPPRTAVIDVPFPRSMSFTGSPLTLAAGATGNLTLNLLGNRAPASGLTVTLSSSDPSLVTVPSTVSFAAGSTSVPVPVTGRSPGSAVITASATVVSFPATATADVKVTGAISVPANTPVRLGQSTALVVTLPAPAPAGGVTVRLASSDASKVTVTPASIVIPQGATTASTPAQVTGVGIGSATITATSRGYVPGTGTVTVAAPTMAFTGPPPPIVIGLTANLTLSLTGGQAPAGGLTVSLSSSDASKATVPATVSFGPGATSATVPVTGAAAGSTTITASAAGIASATASVTVTPPPTVTAAYAANSLALANVILTNTSAVTAINLRIVSITNITAPAPNVIVLSPNQDFPKFYGNLAGGQAGIHGGAFTATAGSLNVPFSFTITYLADNMPPRTAVIDVPFPRAMSFSGSPLSIRVGASGTLTLNLTGLQAPAGGLTASLSSSDPSRVTVPASVTFAAGATTVPVLVTGVGAGTAVITANANINAIFNPATATATVNVTGAIGAPANTPVRLGEAAAFVVTLPAPAPAGGVTLALASSDASKVTVTPASVLIPQGATTAATPPQVTGAGIGSATITASASGYPPASGTVTVAAPTMAFTGAPLSIVIGRTGNLTLTLSGGRAPAGGLTVSLSSSDASKAAVPATVSFAAGTTSATVPVTAATPGMATITASATGIASTTASVTVTPPPTVTAAYGLNSHRVINLVLINSSAVPAINVRITSMSVTAPAPNVIVPPDNAIPAPYGNLAGGEGRASVWAFKATAGSLDVPYTLTMTLEADNMPPRTAVVEVPFPRAMSFAGAPPFLRPGGGAVLTLNLTGLAAPPGGLIVSLSASDPSVVLIPATVTVAAGATAVGVPVSAFGFGTVAITATANINVFFNPATATITVTVR